MKLSRVGSLLVSFFLLGFGLVASHSALTVQIGQNFTASSEPLDTSAQPPDNDGAIGPYHYVELINGRYSVWSRATWSKVQTMTDTVFWNNAGVTFNSGVSQSDPRIIYDLLSQRWFASEIDFNSRVRANRFLLAISTTNDPTGVWKGIAFQADPAGNFADFPTIGLDANGVYLGANIFAPGGNTFLGVLLTSIPKADLLLSTPTFTNRTTTGVMTQASRGFTLQPAINFSPTNFAEAIIATETAGIEGDGTNFYPHYILKEFFVNGATNAGATFTDSTNITVPAYVIPLDPPQPDNIQPPTLSDGDSRISACVYQIGDVLYAVHGCTNNTRAAIRWYRLRVSDDSLLEAGTISDTNLHLFYPSIAANQSGYVAIAFNGCSTNTFVGSYAVAGETRNGVTSFSGLKLLKAGVANYEVPDRSGESRWGDFSALNVDPVNPNSFWTIQQFVSSANVYSTQVTELRLSPFIPTLQAVASADHHTLTFSWPTNDVGSFLLESTTSLSPPTIWLPVGNIVNIVAGRNTTTIAAGDRIRFFRLRQ